MLEVRTADGKTHSVDEDLAMVLGWLGEPESHPVIKSLDGWYLSTAHIVSARVSEKFTQESIPAPDVATPAYAAPNAGYVSLGSSQPYWQTALPVTEDNASDEAEGKAD